jgi:hypothetical protein
MELSARSCLIASFCLRWSLSNSVTLCPREEALVWGLHTVTGGSKGRRRIVDGGLMAAADSGMAEVATASGLH